MTTARAVGITRTGGPEVLAVIEREVREPGPGEIRLAVRAAAVNPTDIGLRERGAEELPPPWGPGMDAAVVGHVTAVSLHYESSPARKQPACVMAMAPRRAPS